MPPRRTRSKTREASSSQRRRREPTPSPPPSPLPWELPLVEQQTRYKMLKKRTLISSKFFDPYTINNLGLQGEVNAFLNTVGWTQFAGMNFQTYKEITLEILSTFYTNYNPYDHRSYPCITFQCLGEAHQLTLEDFNNIFGFPSQGITWNVPDFSPQRAWEQLTGELEYDPSKSKSTLIRSHALRYIHRVMSLCIFGRGCSTGVVTKVELLFLWAMQNNIQVNTGAWLLKHIWHVAKCKLGKICIGGLLTIIATAFGFVPIDGVHHVVAGSHLVDIDTLINMHMCQHMGGGRYRLLDATGHVIQTDDEEEAEEEQQDEDQDPLEAEHADIHDVEEPAAFASQTDIPPQPLDSNMIHIMERFDRLETRLTHHENSQRDFQQQVMQLLQRNMDATSRIEDKLANWSK